MTERRYQLFGLASPPSDWLMLVGSLMVMRGRLPVASSPTLAKECISIEMS